MFHQRTCTSFLFRQRLTARRSCQASAASSSFFVMVFIILRSDQPLHLRDIPAYIGAHLAPAHLSVFHIRRTVKQKLHARPNRFIPILVHRSKSPKRMMTTQVMNVAMIARNVAAKMMAGINHIGLKTMSHEMLMTCADLSTKSDADSKYDAVKIRLLVISECPPPTPRFRCRGTAAYRLPRDCRTSKPIPSSACSSSGPGSSHISTVIAPDHEHQRFFSQSGRMPSIPRESCNAI